MSVRPLLLFDLDGTLTDSITGVVTSMHHALAALGRTWPPMREERLIVGPPLHETLASLGMDDDEVERGVTAYRERYTTIGWRENEVFDGIAELLSDLTAGGYRMAVATSKPQVQARRIIEHFELAPHFEVVAGADPDTGRHAKGDVIEYCLRELDVEPVTATEGGTHEVLMIGDRAHDVEGAAHWGIPCCIVRWGYGSPQEWDTARWATETVAELRDVIEGW